MTKTCAADFEESLLSGYVDGELTQQNEQRVRLHLEGCESCAGLLRDLEELRSATRGTRFRVPPDDQWSELPRSGTSFLLRRVGWLLLIGWLLAAGGFGLWKLAQAPVDPWQLLLGLGIYAGIGLLFLSVLLDRIKARKTDRYRRVEK